MKFKPNDEILISLKSNLLYPLYLKIGYLKNIKYLNTNMKYEFNILNIDLNTECLKLGYLNILSLLLTGY